jgi:hypothetical protein
MSEATAWNAPAAVFAQAATIGYPALRLHSVPRRDVAVRCLERA